MLDTTGVSIHDVDIANMDDCVALKKGSRDIKITDIKCSRDCGGIAIGSLGQYPDHVDVVSDVTVTNAHFDNCQYAARLKSWTGDKNGTMSGGLTGGGGTGSVTNINYSKLTMVGSMRAAVYIDTCYGGPKDDPTCGGYPSKVKFDHLSFTDIHGDNATSILGDAVLLNCPGGVCTNVQVSDVTIPGNVVCNGVELAPEMHCIPLKPKKSTDSTSTGTSPKAKPTAAPVVTTRLRQL